MKKQSICPATDAIAFLEEPNFFTVNVLKRKSHLLVERIEKPREAVRITKKHRPFHVDAWVVLPEHIQCIWTLPQDDHDFSGRWRSIKKAFSKSIPKTEYRSKSRVKRHERGIWQRRFWEYMCLTAIRWSIETIIPAWNAGIQCSWMSFDAKGFIANHLRL
ncbi:REP-associated tyrosine transposase [Methylomarinum vadi]|uniref:REP-associated tyrosine transposase n=1 Tax=Methylomarinum vadi TaxID=438855 RepID=UPI0006920B24|nr:transposase [Methylomarinum vadi]